MQLATRGAAKRSTPPYTFEEESNAEFCFPTMPGRGRNLAGPPAAPLSAQLSSMSRDGCAALTIVSQPEQQHRARYQTEGSRGAVKDRTGNGFPIVKVVELQLFLRRKLICEISFPTVGTCFKTKYNSSCIVLLNLNELELFSLVKIMKMKN